MQRAAQIIHALAEAGHRAFIVGGAVRDQLMGCTPKDIDLATLATPEVVEQVARDNGWETVCVGRAFGIVVVVVDGEAYEVASARTEWYGEDSRRPAGVAYAGDIREDLARRDFTINAMAQSIDGGIIDPFGGQEDLQRGIIRAVGNPAERFQEDALRPYRAVRFAARYGFRVDEDTQGAIPDMLHRVSGLSVERVRDELEKTLLAPHAAEGLALLVQSGLADTTCCHRENGISRQVNVLPELQHLVGLPQNPRYHRFDAWEHTLAVVAGVPGELSLRWAALLHDVAKGLPSVRCQNQRGELADHGHDRIGAEMTADILARLKVPPAVAARVVWLVRHHMTFPAPNRKAIVKWLRRFARDFRSQEALADAVNQLLALRQADLLAGKESPDLAELEELVRVVRDVLATVPFYTANLAISGGQVARELSAGPQVGQFLASLLERVQAGQLENSAEILASALNKKVKRNRDQV